MSVGHHPEAITEKSAVELDRIVGQNDTPDLMAEKFTVDHGHDVAYGGGASVDRGTVFVDRKLYDQITSGEVRVPGMSARQVLARIADHEHTEKAIDDGDNDVDVYEPAHAFALTQEHRGVVDIIGPSGPERYEDNLRPALEECQRRFLRLNRDADPPKALWCGPYLDHPSRDDEKILAVMRARGVADASKLSKFEVHYGIGPEECRRCTMFAAGSGLLRRCDLVSGLVRATRWCNRWEEKRGIGKKR